MEYQNKFSISVDHQGTIYFAPLSYLKALEEKQKAHFLFPSTVPFSKTLLSVKI